MSGFDQALKERAAREDCPAPAGFDGRIEKILEGLPAERQPGKRARPLRTVLLAAALCALCAVSAVALSPTLREDLAASLGGFEPYSQTVEGVAAVDQGIEIRAVSTLVDESGGTIYLAATDLTGDRLEAGMGLWIHTAKSFDAETGTALFAVPVSPGVAVGGGEPFLKLENPYPLRFRVIYPTARIEFEGVPLPWEQAGEEILESYTLEEGDGNPMVEDRTVLKPGQTPMALEGTDLFSISSMGWDDQGTFHVLLEMAEGVDGSERGIRPSIDERLLESTGYYTTNNSDGQYRYQEFIIDKGRYVDMAFQEASKYELEEILPDALQGYVRRSQPIRGEWTLEVPLELLPARTVAVRDTLGRKDLVVESLTFSVQKIQAEGSTWGVGSATLGNMPLTVYLADGTTRRAVPGSGSWALVDGQGEGGAEGRFQSLWSFEEPVDPQAIVGVALAQRYIPIDGDTAGEGSWLEEVP